MMLLEQTVLAAERAHEERSHHAERFNVPGRTPAKER
jgi:hypothetical protein